jgi:hypothetical protein
MTSRNEAARFRSEVSIGAPYCYAEQNVSDEAISGLQKDGFLPAQE